MSSEKNRQSDHKPGPNLIRAWFDTVINPLIEALNLERKYLERKHWSWNHYRAKLETLLPVGKLIEPVAKPNLEQIFRFYPELRLYSDAHDANVSTLWREVNTLQHQLEQSDELRALYEKMAEWETAQSRDEAGRKFSTTTTTEDAIAVFAEHIINSEPELPSYYRTSELWNSWRDKLLQLQQSESIRPYYEEVVARGEMLKQSVEVLLDKLEEIREGLSIEHDVPIVQRNLAA